MLTSSKVVCVVVRPISWSCKLAQYGPFFTAVVANGINVTAVRLVVIGLSATVTCSTSGQLFCRAFVWRLSRAMVNCHWTAPLQHCYQVLPSLTWAKSSASLKVKFSSSTSAFVCFHSSCHRQVCPGERRSDRSQTCNAGRACEALPHSRQCSR